MPANLHCQPSSPQERRLSLLKYHWTAQLIGRASERECLKARIGNHMVAVQLVAGVCDLPGKRKRAKSSDRPQVASDAAPFV